jgi:hypothetical protein
MKVTPVNVTLTDAPLVNVTLRQDPRTAAPPSPVRADPVRLSPVQLVTAASAGAPRADFRWSPGGYLTAAGFPFARGTGLRVQVRCGKRSTADPPGQR